MSRIDDLIRQHCPNGVDYWGLTDVGRWSGGGTPSKQDINFWRGGTIPWVTSKDMGPFELAGTKEYITQGALRGSAAKVIPADSVAVVMRSGILKHTLPVSLVPFQATVNQDLRALTCRSDVMPRYMVHVLRANAPRILDTCRKVGGTVESIDAGEFMRVRIPIPPIEVQEEVVRVLDTFRALEAELGAELAAELEARRRQYADYRESLLISRGAQGVRWIPMGELGQIFRGKRFTKADYVDAGGVGCIHYGEIYTDYGTSATSTVSRLRGELAPGLRFATKGDVVLTDVGETVEDVGKAVAWLGSEDVAIHDHCYVFRSPMNPVFVSHYMQTARFRADKDRHIARTKVKTLLPGGLERIAVPVPPAVEQARTVAILDRFDALVNDLSVGLPAELSARRMQFAYYRDRLLTFEEVA